MTWTNDTEPTTSWSNGTEPTISADTLQIFMDADTYIFMDGNGYAFKIGDGGWVNTNEKQHTTYVNTSL